jgi:hypothetical protein
MGHKVRLSPNKAPNFLERRKAKVSRITLPRTSLHEGREAPEGAPTEPENVAPYCAP